MDGLVPVRQMPGSAKGVMLITLEDKTSNAELIVWPPVFPKPPHHPRGEHAWIPREAPHPGPAHRLAEGKGEEFLLVVPYRFQVSLLRTEQIQNNIPM